MRFFRLREKRSSPTRRINSVRVYRPMLEAFEDRVVLSHAALAAPALAPALAAPVTQQASSLLPLTINSVNLTGVANGVLSLVANATTAAGQAIQIPFTLADVTPTGSTTPILDLHVGALHLNVLGLKVDTSDICLKITAQSGAGNLLGNALSDVAHLLDQGLNLNQILGTLGTTVSGLTTELNTLTTGLGNLLSGAFSAIGSPTNAATGGASVTSTGATQILHLSLGPVDLNLLGLMVHLDNCNNGPVTVDITAQPGPGNLLGNLLGGLSHLLDSNANINALLNKLDKVAGQIGGIL